MTQAIDLALTFRGSFRLRRDACLAKQDDAQRVGADDVLARAPSRLYRIRQADSDLLPLHQYGGDPLPTRLRSSVLRA